MHDDPFRYEKNNNKINRNFPLHIHKSGSASIVSRSKLKIRNEKPAQERPTWLNQQENSCLKEIVNAFNQVVLGSVKKYY